MSTKVFLLEGKKLKNPLYIRLLAKYSSTSAFHVQSSLYSMTTLVLSQSKQFCLKNNLKDSLK